MEEIKIKLPLLRFIALATWIVSIYLASTVYGDNFPAFLQGAIIVVFPAAVSYASVLRFLIGQRLDVFLAVVLSLVLGLIGIELWIGGKISDRQVILAWIPTYQLCSIVIGYYSFLRLMRREPVTVLFDVEAGKWPDRVFFILVATLHIMVPAWFLAQAFQSSIS